MTQFTNIAGVPTLRRIRPRTRLLVILLVSAGLLGSAAPADEGRGTALAELSGRYETRQPNEGVWPDVRF